MKNILILGGGGFIGRNITEFLVKRGDCFVVAADIKEGSNWNELALNYPTVFKSVLDDFSYEEAFKNLGSELGVDFFNRMDMVVENGDKMEKKLVSASQTEWYFETILYKLSLLKELGY